MLVHDAIFGSSLINLISVSELVTSADYLMAISPEQLQTQVLHLLNRFDFGFEIGLFFFSFHLGIVGYLVFRSGEIHKIFGVLLYIAAAGYLIDSICSILLPDPPDILWKIFMAPCLIGELALIIWLLIKGGKE